MAVGVGVGDGVNVGLGVSDGAGDKVGDAVGDVEARAMTTRRPGVPAGKAEPAVVAPCPQAGSRASKI